MRSRGYPQRLGERLSKATVPVSGLLREEAVPVGLVGLLGDVAVPGLSWMLCRQAWGRGLMTEAADAVVNYAFGSLGLDRVEAWVESDEFPLPFDGPQDRPHRTRTAGATVSAPRRSPTSRSFLEGRANRNPPQCSVSRSTLPVPMSARISTSCGRCSARGRSMRWATRRPWSVWFSVRGASARVFGCWRRRRHSPPRHRELDVGTEFDPSYGRRVAVGADIAAPPVEQPWGMREFVLRLPDGHRLVMTGSGLTAGGQDIASAVAR